MGEPARGPRYGGDRSLPLQGQLEEDGIRASIRRICTVLGCHRSNVYYRSKAKAKRTAKTDAWLVEEIRKIIKERGWQRWKHSYGNRPRVKGLKSVAAQVNNRWTIDMTHLFTKQDGWCHLVAVINCCDRYLVGWRFSKSGKAGISAGALEDALIREKILPGHQALVIRSDNGLVFGSKWFHETISRYRPTQEYITPYTPEQNGMIERFFRSFKEECVWQQSFATFDEAYNKIAYWIDHYNQERPHSA